MHQLAKSSGLSKLLGQIWSNLSNFVKFCPILSNFVQSGPIWSIFFQLVTIWLNLVLIWSSLVQYGPFRFKLAFHDCKILTFLLFPIHSMDIKSHLVTFSHIRHVTRCTSKKKTKSSLMPLHQIFNDVEVHYHKYVSVNNQNKTKSSLFLLLSMRNIANVRAMVVVVL